MSESGSMGKPTWQVWEGGSDCVHAMECMYRDTICRWVLEGDVGVEVAVAVAVEVEIGVVLPLGAPAAKAQGRDRARRSRRR